MDKETFIELERLKSALTELDKCSQLIKDAKIVSEKSLVQVEEVIATFKDRSDKLISQFENEAKLLSDTRENLNEQLTSQLEIHHEVLDTIFSSVSDLKSKLVVIQKSNDEMFKKILSEQLNQKKNVTKMLFISIGLMIGLIVFRLISRS